MQGLPVGALRDLLTAAESICNHQGCGRGVAYGGQKNALGERLGDVELFAFEAEGASHSTAAGIEECNLGSGAAKKVQLGGHFVDRFVVAVSVKKDVSTRKRGRLVVGGLASEEIAEEIRLGTKAARSGVLGEKISQLVVEDAGTRRLEKDDGNTGVDLGLKGL